MSSPARNQSPGLSRQSALKWALALRPEIQEDRHSAFMLRISYYEWFKWKGLLQCSLRFGSELKFGS